MNMYWTLHGATTPHAAERFKIQEYTLLRETDLVHALASLRVPVDGTHT